MLEEKDHCSVDMLFLIIEAFIERTAGFQNNTNMAGVHCVYSKIVSDVVLQDYGGGWSVAKVEKFYRDVCVFKNKAVNVFLRVCAPGLCLAKNPPIAPFDQKCFHFEICLCRMRCHTNNSTQVLSLCIFTHMNKVQRELMRCYSIWIK